jgi:hypothetical protein
MGTFYADIQGIIGERSACTTRHSIPLELLLTVVMPHAVQPSGSRTGSVIQTFWPVWILMSVVGTKSPYFVNKLSLPACITVWDHKEIQY